VAREGEIKMSCNLERMELRDYTSLEKLPSKMQNLKDLQIQNCPKIMGQTIPPNNLMSQLESLEIGKCDSLTSFPFAKGRLAALKTFYIYECNGVESLEEITLESLSSLTID